MMNNDFKIDINTVHLWRLCLPEFTQDRLSLSELLSHDETQRAERFQFPIHHDRFTMTRGLLRKTLSLYTGIDPKAMAFQYGEHGKPFLANTSSHLKFNVSHSHDMAVFALTIDKEIGIDIEKMEASFKESVAKRFFSPDEYLSLMQLNDSDRVTAFYKIWSRKEALIKVLGKGLYTPLDSFDVSSQLDTQSITLDNTQPYVIQHVDVHPDYQAAFATPAPVIHTMQWQWTQDGPGKR